MSPRRTPTLLDTFLGAPAAALLAVVLFGLVNFLAARHYRRLDWTRAHLFSLSPRSRDIVRTLHEPMDLYVLLGPREPQYSDVTELAQRYAGESAMLHVHNIDPDHQRDRFLELTRRLGIRVGRSSTSDVAAEAAIVIARGDRHWEIPRESLAGLGEDSTGEEGNAGRSMGAQVTVERAISEAILRVDRNDPTKVCFASGHGELALEGGDDSVSMLVTELRHVNVSTQAVQVRGATSVPNDCDALVIAGPQQAFTDADAEIVARYLRGGGNVLMLVDPMFVDRRWVPTGLESVAAMGGIELAHAIAVEPDPAKQLPGQLPVTFIATDLGEHPITHSLRGATAPVLISTSRVLRRASGSSVVPTGILRTSPAGWGEVATADAVHENALTHDAEDLNGPVDLAMAAQIPAIARAPHGREAAGRLVVFGSSHTATNEMLGVAVEARFANGYLVVAALGWLTARHELVEIPPRPASAAALSISVQDIRHVQVYSMILVPLAAALVGIAVWRSRKAA